ncbi:acetaldehyde dehydrogenase (acetylating) [Enterocloster clostridioformis]|uniref:acetaldehyde dehydrogenase (acetylating) n=1 Tax=Enterocloster clostridioformis TaxID=1531 RepID=UPI00080CABC3|nr:acetaldehyde dehydrogenase (acetylating) [Enterocloster clostridioformis]ANU45715.1 acetaldehyde dehydrogenase (acetylating) [Lachnoclostridium sp. YL32]NDO30423.1 acetaldehyde dehydrogenase (acetylating) [Enterocloster clostridioformis]OXE67776.1 acetaldehyde dehydrogenase (acetylating) [Enterocloster clostridioformis]QQQ99531.1 acetaldehyde dehydrogenase (acetylating) [Enterocloster clostridioformis]
MKKIKAGIIGPGNIGTDLMYKIMKSSNLEMKLMAGIVESEGIKRAAGLGFETSIRGVDAVAADDEIRIVFDATSAKAHLHNAPILKQAGKIVMDMTPAAVGPYVVPCVNLDSLPSDTDNFNMVTCGGQAAVPIAYAINRAADSEYTEIVSALSSKSAGPGTRANIDEFTETTSRALEIVAGSDKGKAIIVLNPANPPLMMTNTIYALVKTPDVARIRGSVEAIVKEVKSYVPGYRLRVPPVIDGNKVTVIIEVEGAGDFLPAYSGNLDIINQAAVATAEKVAARLLNGKEEMA